MHVNVYIIILIWVNLKNVLNVHIIVMDVIVLQCVLIVKKKEMPLIYQIVFVMKIIQILINNA